ncbi:hypothetical protein BGX34_003330 [Mortierella sp. NVP85]|nr:hypothetical protein BGX34_003330 [Mortierella sp. NVP85]
MAPLGKKTDKQWRFVGQEVTDVKNLTLAHVLSVYGLGSSTRDGDPEVEDPLSEPSTKSIFPYCGNRYSGSAPEESSGVKGASNNGCTMARCKDGNPHCLNYMGQSQWEEDDAWDKYFEQFTEKTDPGLLKRPENTPSGMKNLGATCYANSLLQVWFHDLVFRDAIYRARFNDEDLSTNSLYQLQLLFVHLDRGLKSFYNPLSLVNTLKLDTTMQQDAQEFCNLFMARIDNQLQKQHNAQLRTFVQDQFQGHYSYNTTCNNCKKTSVRDCTFYELMLNIRDNCTLMDCLEEFVEPEALTGADRYYCSTCESLQDASREIKLETLPNVLNIQLMRFVYDNTTWTKKKSKDTIRFSEVIDASALLRTSDVVEYELSAVLVHSGPSAHSGHFLAHVLQRENNKWFVLNDEEVEEFHGTTFDPEDYAEAASNSKSKAKKATTKNGSKDDKQVNYFSSRNAYMLTYVKKTSAPPTVPCPPPPETLEIVTRDNEVYENDLQEYDDYKKTIKRDFESSRSARQELYRCWHVTSHQPARQILEEQYQIRLDPVLTTEDICQPCVANMCQDKLYNLVHRQDIEEFERKAKSARSPAAVWVSKAWLGEWQKVYPRFHPAHGSTTDDPNPASEAYIGDVLCQHSKLSCDKTKRKLINKAALEVLARTFGELALPESGIDECDVCFDRLQPQKDIATSEKQELVDIFNSKRDRIPTLEPGKKYHVVSQVGFMKKWLAHVKRPLAIERPTTIDNTGLLCKHGQFVFDLDNDVDRKDEEGICIIKEEEWKYLHGIYGGGPDIVISLTEEIPLDGNQNGAHSTIESTPPLCSACRNERILDFSTTTLIVRVYSQGESGGKKDDSVVLSEQGNTTSDQNEVCSTGPSAAKRKLVHEALGQEFGTRRSKRSKPTKKPYKEIKIPVDKWETVMDLKLRIMQKTNVVPLYQKLVHENAELDKNEATIADLAIPPNAVVEMVAFDQGMDDLVLSTLQDVEPTPGDVGGFGGTGLAEDWF